MEVSTFMTSLISAAMFSIHANASVKLIGKIDTVTNILWNVYNGIHWILGCSCKKPSSTLCFKFSNTQCFTTYCYTLNNKSPWLHRTEMNQEHVWCLRCTEAPDIAYALPISRKLVNIEEIRILSNNTSDFPHISLISEDCLSPEICGI